MTIQILKSIAKEGQVFSFGQLYRKTHIEKEALSVILSRLEDRGFIERIEKGKYLIIPLDSEKGSYTLHEFVIGSYLIEPSAISYWSALHYYGLTEQIPRTVFLQTPARKKKSRLNIFGLDYQIVRIKKEKFYGLRKEWIEEAAVSITDKEKTIIDCLDKPQYSGGIIEVAKALKTGLLNQKRINEYVLKIDNLSVVRRLGFLCDQIGLPLALPPIKSKKYLLLDPTMPSMGPVNTKWRLIINLDTTFLDDLE
jgi:predicted transcriptional regulator of viral defense system